MTSSAPLTTLPTALIAEIPEAEPAVGPLRAQLDANARLGVPAHVTVIFPFAPGGAVDGATRDRLAGIFGEVPAFGFRLDRLGWFGDGVLWLGPHDPEPFQVLTERVYAAFPDYPPFGGQFPESVPHLTVGHGVPLPDLQAAARTVRPRLPIDGVCRTVTLLTQDPAGRWQRDTVFRLA